MLAANANRRVITILRYLYSFIVLIIRMVNCYLPYLSAFEQQL